MSVLQVPMFQTQNSPAGLSLGKGLELKLGTGAVRRLNYVACDPQRCEASIAMDDALVKEATAAPSATITIYSRNETALTINVASLKGIDKALGAIGR
jgi:invasion protein IalB